MDRPMNDKERQFDETAGARFDEKPGTGRVLAAKYPEFGKVCYEEVDIEDLRRLFHPDPDVLKNDEVDKAMKKVSAAVALFKMLHPDAKEHTEIISTVNSITEVKSWTAPGYEQVTKTLPQPDLGAGLAATKEAVDSLKLMYPGAEFRTALTVSDYGVTLDVVLAYPEE